MNTIGIKEVARNDKRLIKQAEILIKQQRPLSLDTVMKLNLLERQLKAPSTEFESFFEVAIKDMNIASVLK